MNVTIGRVLTAAACLVWLTGCQTASTSSNPFAALVNPPASGSEAAASTGSVQTDAPPATPQLLGADPNDDLSTGKKYFRQGSYGLAERHFRKAVELHPRDAESWVGLAAAYDRLRRFDLADRAYSQAIRIVGPSPEILNNQGFSYILRGDYRRARATLLAAKAKDPQNPFIQNNLRLLAESTRKAKAVN
jgi:Flp pilus assembly protein TadD